ncbi:Tol-Pal system beta propeller repeat protein TolB [Piscinibacter sp.]|jgi:TolB protein|uniref:Tol-Pal system beta propeller repeat protein TolB n=1 Tax=Piscinibacter sp. TaxID=1903157 RepID=UPI001B414269|nr:Tol-Pal system beta propeller repeat protein TolB [Piscinibacter sp.]MBK7529327.1 Tol-Pal system protein TolB [Piscinibacter sp.]MBP6543613.1 Tol-Pal system protein TolB [Piscinibacter sp.]
MKRRTVLQLAALPASLGLFGTAQAQFRVEISGVGATQLPIAVPRFRDEEKAPQPVSAIIRADLERSGFFRPIDANGVALDESSRPVMADWRGRSADALAAGSVQRLADGRFDVRFKLWDVVKGSEIGGQASAVDAADLRLAAHRIADYIYEKLTGDKGVFSTRIAYVTRGGGRYTLRVADADGEGGQVALNSPEPIISPAWSPDGRELAYVSFESQKAVVYAQEVMSGKRRPIANFRGSNSAPAWSPDGSTLAATLSREGGSQLFLMDRNGGNVRRLTSSQAIDTEPVFEYPDGKRIYFVSDRGGGPQVYRIATGGGNVERITFGGSYNISPAVSPDGRTLAFIARQGNSFKLHTLDLSSPGSQPVPLTDTTDDESPSFSPNGKLIIYATRAGGRDVLMTTTLDGKIKARLVSTTADVREPNWSPYGR